MGQLAAALERDWDDTVLMVVSDHDQETVTVEEPVDLHAAAAAAEVDVLVVLEGNGAVVVGPDPLAGSWLSDVEGIEDDARLGPDLRFVSAGRGRWFAPAGTQSGLKGMHGGLGTRGQVAIVAGGHPAVGALGVSLGRHPPDAEDWAVTVADLLDLELAEATGRSLVG